MKYIPKNNEPRSLKNWVTGQQSAGLLPIYGDLQNPEKGECRSELLREQGALCCYCNSVIADTAMHIEHLQPQTVHPELSVVWSNMLGCCKPQNLKGKRIRTQVHCGEFRGFKDVGVSPLDLQCESHFRYTLEGEIEPVSADDFLGDLAITNLNLRAERLRNARQSVIKTAYLDVDNLSEEEWLAVYVERSNDEFQEYAGMLRWFYDSKWAVELQNKDDDSDDAI